MSRWSLIACGVALAISINGCASLSLPLVGKNTDVVRATPDNPVMDIISVWEPGEGRGMDDLPSRGFAGQLMFFTYKDPIPALVDGRVSVYVFDDVGSEAEQSRPLWQHTFTSAEWNTFARQTTLGTAYQLFIPYVRKGSQEGHCTLRVKYEPSDGGALIYSKMANVTLPGDQTDKIVSTIERKRIEPNRIDDNAPLSMQPMAATKVRRLRSSTVSLPGRRNVSPRAAARLQQLAQQMVRDQQTTIDRYDDNFQGDIQQVGYVEEFSERTSSEREFADEAETSSGRVYRLH